MTPDSLQSCRMAIVVGVDLGGTNVRAEAFDGSGTSRGARVERPSRAQEGVESCVGAICGAIREAIGENRVDVVGMAVPGHIRGGVVRWAPNFGSWRGDVFEHWRDVPLGERVSKEVGVRVRMGNDANLAALGEYRYGSGKNSANGLVMLTLGTGVGCGVVLTPACLSSGLTSAAVLIGGNGGGAELGHMVIVKDGDPHPSAVSGTLEAYCNKDAIVRRGVENLRSREPELLGELTKGVEAALSPALLSEAANRGSEAAKAAWRETGEYLGVGIANVINAFAPEVIAIGGQIAKAGEPLLEPAIESARRYSIPTLFADCRIVIAEQLEDAGILGAAAMAQECVQ